MTHGVNLGTLCVCVSMYMYVCGRGWDGEWSLLKGVAGPGDKWEVGCGMWQAFPSLLDSPRVLFQEYIL